MYNLGLLRKKQVTADRKPGTHHIQECKGIQIHWQQIVRDKPSTTHK